MKAKKNDNRDHAFDALQKIANAAWDFAEDKELHAPSKFVMVVPCLVVSAPLFAASYDYEAECFKIERTRFGRLSWTGCRSGTVVDVVHIDSIEEYASKLAKTMNTIYQVLEPVSKNYSLVTLL